MNVESWILGEVDRHGRDTTGTDYEKMLRDRRPQGIDAYEENDAAYLPESPMDPYERSLAQEMVSEAADCSNSIGGLSGKDFDASGRWRRNCKIFEPTL